MLATILLRAHLSNARRIDFDGRVARPRFLHAYRTTSMTTAIRPRRLFVSGGSRLTTNAALLWTELGRLLAEEHGLVIITGGLLGRTDGPPAPTADRSVVDGML